MADVRSTTIAEGPTDFGIVLPAHVAMEAARAIHRGAARHGDVRHVEWLSE